MLSEWVKQPFKRKEPLQSDASMAIREVGNTTSEEVYHEAARHFLDVQLSTHDILDTKTAHTFSVGSVVLPVTFALLNLGTVQLPRLAELLLGLALIVYLLLLGCAARASFIRALEFRPHIPTLQQHVQHFSGDQLRFWVATEYEESSNTNAEMLRQKAQWVGGATAALYLESLLLSAAALLTLLL